jgi:general L-amino acid transport system substrate-binding protein
LDVIKARGKLICGVSLGVLGFSAPDASGRVKGLDADYCRAFAAAIVGDPEAVEFRHATVQQRFVMLRSGEIDILSRTTTHTFQRSSEFGLIFAPTVYFDGQAVLVRSGERANSVFELEGKTVCVMDGTPHKRDLEDFVASAKIPITVKGMTVQRSDELLAAIEAGHCDAASQDASNLAQMRARHKDPKAFTILPEHVSKAPLAPVVVDSSPRLAKVVAGVVNATFEAEERGVTAATVDKAAAEGPPPVRRMLGGTSGVAKGLGLDDAFAHRAIKAVGNYGEMFDRNLGKGSVMGLARGPNRPWTRGGLQYAVPF